MDLQRMEPYSRYRRDDEGIVKWFLKLKFQLTKYEAQGTIQAIVSWQLRTECMFIAFAIVEYCRDISVLTIWDAFVCTEDECAEIYNALRDRRLPR